ncbi:2-aminoadipate transaminase [Clostridium acetireducens DSM 10703]|uniref:HTH-type transcriptional regulator NorG n=1 Tax=Clostridium acetireducens DSM 10703 TaxID=1121290 RepID=A0A1E8EWR5_9CLOT|nr:PLP-dependent aminotransferase family protein [Clostridium acetireducens]OFI04956.1 2-aminoadipate transaminase [Clostridium acetireducens DSM 10703]
MEKYLLYFNNEEIPKYVQIAKHIKNLIDSNNIKDGEKLPSIRKLSKFLEVNNVTIVNAYKKLEMEGYAFQKMGSGTYAKRKDVTRKYRKQYSDILKTVSSNNIKDYIDFTGEIACTEFFPVDSFKNVINEVLDRDGVEALAYQETLGYEGLRNSISKFFWNNHKDIDDILIVSGAQQGIDIVSKAIINVNDKVIVEKPTYSGALSVFKWRRTNIFELEIHENGIDLDKFEKILKKNKVKCFYTMSYFQNPTGMSYNLDEKKKILEMAEKYNFYIIEDDYLSELIYDSNIEYKSFKSLDENDRVIYIKSFSKIFLPGIRIGYLISPKKFKEAIQNSKVNTDISTSSLMQRALDLYINKGFWKKYINNLKIVYKDRYEFMKMCINKILSDKVTFFDPGGGLHFYLKINDNINIDCMKLFNECKKNKILITPGILFYKNIYHGKKYFRISFSQVDKLEIEKGIKIINSLLEMGNKYE